MRALFLHAGAFPGGVGAAGHNTTVLRGDVVDEVRKLKEKYEGDIVVHGSPRLAQTLIEHDLVDAMHLQVYPVIVGAGRRLFGETTETKRLWLTETKTVGGGIHILIYERADKRLRSAGPTSTPASARSMCRRVPSGSDSPAPASTGGSWRTVCDPPSVGATLPTGTVTFLFTDIEGSTRLLDELGGDAYADALSTHRRAIRTASSAHDGVVVDTEGDSLFVAFRTARDASMAALAIQESLATGPVRVRVGVHTGTAAVIDSGYVGMDVHRAARIATAAHGGQIVLSASTRSLLDPRDGLMISELGAHRLKDLSAAEQLFQLGEGEFPPLRSFSRTNLPVPATRFVGREGELAEVESLLCRDDVPLLCLIGPGGTGKTRLALQAAAEVSDEFPDGVWWTPLAPLSDARLVLATVALTLGVMEEPGRGLTDTLATRLAGRHVLLVMDNVEHLLPAVATDLASLVAECPTLKLLVTSRERLQVAAETVWLVPPLAPGESRELFLERAGAAGMTLEADETISELCDRLDHLPLAIELAAARTIVFSPDQLLQRLAQRLDLLKGGRDADPRQQTLRAAIDWSYELLTPEEQRVFCALSVFTGGCTLEPAEEVASAEPDTLQSLLDKSLLRRRDTNLGPRYWMLATIRDYAAEKLGPGPDGETLRRRHAEWSHRHALQLHGVPGPDVPRGAASDELAQFREDYDNVRSALAWAWTEGEDALGLDLGAACCRYWLGEGLFREAAAWYREALPRIRSASPAPASRLQALKVAGLVAFFVLADSDQADALWTEARSVAEDLHLDDEAAWIDHRRAGVAWERGDLEAASVWHERLLVYHRAHGNKLAEADTLHNLGEARRDLGDFETAEAHLREAAVIYRLLDSVAALASNTHSLADLALDRGDYGSAITLYRDCLASGAGDRRLAAYCLAGIASALAERGRDEEAARVWGSVCAAEQSSGFRILAPERRRYEAHLARLEGSKAWNAGRSLTIQAALDSLNRE